MRINAITPNYNARTFARNNQRSNQQNYNSQTQTNPSFCGEKKQSNSLLRGAQGLMLLSALSGAPACSDFVGGEDDITITQVHNVPAKTDSVKVIQPPIIIHTVDSVPVYLPGETIYRDTIIHDTIPGETKYIYYEKPLDPEISQKDKENAEEVGITTEGDGDYVLSSHFFNAYEGYDEMRELDMDLCSRNGSKYVYNAIRTGYTDDPESGISKVILGKNQQFVRYEYSLSDDKKSFFVKTFVPIDDISISNNRGERNWDVFDNQLKQHSKWHELQTERGEIEIKNAKGGILTILSGGVKTGEASKGSQEQSIRYVNSYDGEREFTNIHVYMGGKYEPFPNPEEQEKYEQNKVDK